MTVLIIGIIFLAGSLVLSVPQWFGLNTVFGFAQLISFRGFLAIGFASIAIISLIFSFTLHNNNAEWLFRIIAIIAVLATITNVTILGVRGITPKPLSENSEPYTITVLAWNIEKSQVPADTIASLIEQYKPDLVSLPEANLKLGTQVVDLLATKGISMQLFPMQGSGKDYTMVMVNKDFGQYQLESQISYTGLATIVVTPVDASSKKPTFLGVHTMSPGTFDHMKYWYNDIGWIRDQCKTYPNAILAGDFNQNLDHWNGVFDGCTDLGTATGQAGIGTWPTNLPPVLGTQIDHILVTTPNVTVEGFSVLNVEAPTDHRPVIGQIGLHN